jgi:asparagine synthase (glutamine-hydrolysing)
MCGIAGIISAEPDASHGPALARMMNVQRHRGPNGEGSWSGRVGNSQVTLGHLRLAIIDLSEAGLQPMFSPDGRSGIIFNGEIYNYRELRSELEGEGVEFRSRSDTEVALWALIRWGERAFNRFNGMWAIAWLDIANQRLILCRDRFGIKPLYWHRHNGTLFFASEIKAILAGSGGRFAVNAKVVGRFLHQGLCDAQAETFFAGIEALPAAHAMTISLSSGAAPVVRHYWRLPDAAAAGAMDSGEAVGAVRELFFDAVRLRLRSDVPVGVLLSGGMDSSAIAAAMRAAAGASADLHAISAVSGRPEYDEKPFMEAVSRHLSCPIHYVQTNPAPTECFDLLEQVIYANDEPVGSFSPAAHYLLMEQAKHLGVTVILSGQGGDEGLCGYAKFLGFYLQDLVRRGHLAGAVASLWSFIRNGTVVSQFELKDAKRYLPGFLTLASHDVCGPQLKPHDYRLPTGLGRGSLNDRQGLDYCRLSVPALVHYEDRMSMAWSREIRLPFLDYRLVELLVTLEPESKLRDGWTKWVLRKAMEDYLPESVVWRKDKQGFTLPHAHWLKHELRERVEALFAGDLLTVKLGLLDREALQRIYAAFCKQPLNRGVISFKDIFGPIALEIWARRFEGSLCLN